jgi:hypothetical protein
MATTPYLSHVYLTPQPDTNCKKIIHLFADDLWKCHNEEENTGRGHFHRIIDELHSLQQENKLNSEFFTIASWIASFIFIEACVTLQIRNYRVSDVQLFVSTFYKNENANFPFILFDEDRQADYRAFMRELRTQSAVHVYRYLLGDFKIETWYDRYIAQADEAYFAHGNIQSINFSDQASQRPTHIYSLCHNVVQEALNGETSKITIPPYHNI